MREVFTMWRSTRMVVLTSITAALYAAALIAFKPLSILPGVTEIRPGVAFVVLCSILFGPAGAWGAAIGNTIGDLAGGLGPGTVIGFVANFLFGLVPYKLYRAMGIEDAGARGPLGVATYLVAAFAGSAACAITVGYGIQAIGLWPIAFKMLANIIFATNALVTGLLGLLLLRAIYPRVAAIGLRWQDILDLPRAGRRDLDVFCAAAVVLALAAALNLGNAHEFGWWGLGPPGGPSLHACVGVPLVVAVLALAAID